MNVLVVGGGRVARAVAANLANSGHRVTTLEPAEHVEWPDGPVPGVEIRYGSGTDPAALESAGIRDVDALAAIAGTDEANLVTAALARYEFGVRRTIARVVDPRHAWLFTSSLGVDVALDQAQLLASLVAEELSLGEMTTLLKLRRGQFELVEERIHPEAVAAGKTVAELELPRESVLVAVIREEGPLVPRGDLRLHAGDEVLSVVRTGLAPRLAALFSAPGDAASPAFGMST